MATILIYHQETLAHQVNRKSNGLLLKQLSLPANRLVLKLVKLPDKLQGTLYIGVGNLNQPIRCRK